MNEEKIYRSVYFSEGTIWNYPLKLVEVIVKGDEYSILIYDTGFEPPYYDVNELPTQFDSGKGLQGAEDALRKRKVFVADWKEVSNLFIYECNAIMRPDIRADIEEIFKVSKANIRKSNSDKAIKSLVDYNGHTVNLHTLFLESVDDEEAEDEGSFFSFGFSKDLKINKLRSYKNDGYIMVRHPSKYNYWGFVWKRPDAGITVLIESKDKTTFSLYDQVNREYMTEGVVVRLELEFLTRKGSIKLDDKGFKKTPRFQFW